MRMMRGRSFKNSRKKVDGHLSQIGRCRTIVDGLLSQSGRSWVKVDGHLTQSGLPKGYKILLFARNFAHNFDYYSPVTSTSFEIGFELRSNFEDS